MSRVSHLEALDYITEGLVPPAAVLQQSHAALVLANVGHKNPKLLAACQEHLHHLRALLPRDACKTLEDI